MSTREKMQVMRAEARNNSRDVPCPACGLCTLLRGDSGLCERCHAKRPEVRSEWERERRLAALKPAPKPARRLPPGTCIVCHQPYGDLTISQHDKVCPSRPEGCLCGKRYWTKSDLRAHRYNCKVWPF